MFIQRSLYRAGVSAKIGGKPYNVEITAFIINQWTLIVTEDRAVDLRTRKWLALSIKVSWVALPILNFTTPFVLLYPQDRLYLFTSELFLHCCLDALYHDHASIFSLVYISRKWYSVWSIHQSPLIYSTNIKSLLCAKHCYIWFNCFNLDAWWMAFESIFLNVNYPNGRCYLGGPERWGCFEEPLSDAWCPPPHQVLLEP